MELEDCETSLVETTFIKPSETGSIRAVTVYQALRSEQLHGDLEFTLDGVKFSKVLLVIHVMVSSDTSDSRGVFNLEDGTGNIRGSLFNNKGLDPATFLAMVQQFDNGLACVMGKLVQFGQKKSIDIESMSVAGYHQAMFHTLECMKLSLMIERLGKSPVPNVAGESVITRVEEIPQAYDSIRIDPGTSNQPSYSFCGLPDDDQGGNLGSVQTGAQFPQPCANHGEGSSSRSPVQAEYRLPTLPSAPELESSRSVNVQLANPRAAARTPSPLSTFGSSLRIISPRFVPHSSYGQLAQLRATQRAIVSSLCQLEGNTPYGVWITDVFESVAQVIDTTWEEFITDIEWLLEEAYIVRPLDDDRITLTPRASA